MTAADAVPNGGPAPGTEPDLPPVVISVEHLSKTFLPSPAWMKVLLKSAIKEPVVALDDVSFQLRQGETCIVVGPNGAGKSTLFRILTGLTTSTSGQAKILGHDVNEGRKVRALIGYMPAEDRSLMLRHTCAQNLAFRGKLHGIPLSELPERVDEVLDQVGILRAKHQAAVSLSTGMRARLQLAAALLHEPDVLILDEPTATVDPVGAHDLLTLIDELTSARGLSVILSSHRLDEIDVSAHKVIFLDKGRVIHDGNLGELRKLWEVPRYRVELAQGTDLVGLAARLECEQPDFQIDVDDPHLEITTQQPLGDVINALGPTASAILSIEQVVMPLRVLFHKLVAGEIQGRR